MCNLFGDRGYIGLKVKSDSQLGKIDTFDSSRAYIHNYCTSIPHIAYMHAAFLRLSNKLWTNIVQTISFSGLIKNLKILKLIMMENMWNLIRP